MLKPVLTSHLEPQQRQQLDKATQGYSAASFASLRSELKVKAAGGTLPFERIHEIMADSIPPAIELTRRYQTLQALINCTRRSLLPDPKTDEAQRHLWAEELRVLESKGIQ